MLRALNLTSLKQESASLVTSKMIATALIPELALVQEDSMMSTTRVETMQGTHQIMETNTSKPLDTSLCSEKNGFLAFKVKHHLVLSYLPISSAVFVGRFSDSR